MRDRALLYARAKTMRHEPTAAEQVLWRILRGGRMAGLKFRRQVPLGTYIADFACFDPKTVIECDGGQHAESAYDAERDAWLRAGLPRDPGLEPTAAECARAGGLGG